MKLERHVPLTELGDFIELEDDVSVSSARMFRDRMKRRHTIRDFSEAPVPKEAVIAAIEAAGTAPNGANHQPWHFCLVGDREVKRQIREGAEAEEREFYAGRAGEEWLDALAPIGTDAEKPFLETAPYLIVIFAQPRGGPKPGDDKKNYYVRESVGIACGFLIAALHEAGLATLTHTPAPMKFLNEICGRPAQEKPFLILVVGKPAPDATVPEHAIAKKPLSEILSEF